VLPSAAAKPDPGQGKTYALVIGVSRYKQDPPVASLQFADKDATMFAELLRNPIGGGLTDPSQIRVLTNENATRAAIDDAVRDFSTRYADPANTLVVFIAAHGVYLKTEVDPRTNKVIERDPYILTFESNHQDPKTTGYPMEDLRRMAAQQAMRFGRVLVFLDVCHAANVAGVGGGSELDSIVRQVWEGQGGDLGLLLASHAKKFAIESVKFGGGHGAFSYFLVAGLNGAAALAGSDAITFGNLAVYVIKNVSEFTRGEQTPVPSATNDDMVVVADTNKAKITLGPAVPISENEVRALRKRPTQTAATRSATQAADPASAFEDAIRRGALLPGEPASAADQLARLIAGGALTPVEIRGLESRLRIALEDRGQEILSQYLLGDEIPQDRVEFERCSKLFEQALLLNPPDANFDRSRSLFCKGRALIFNRSYPEAERLLRESIRIDPRRSYAHNALGIALLEQVARSGAGFDAAEDALRTAMRFAPYWAYPVHNLALLSTERGDYEAAIRLYRSAMAVAPRFSYLPYNLGLLYQRLGDFENAVAWFTNARELVEQHGERNGSRVPARSNIWNALGAIAQTEKREGRAIDLFRRALADDPDNRNARHNLAGVLGARANFSEADALWLQNLAPGLQDPTRARGFLPSRIAYAESLMRRGESRLAIEQFEAIVGMESGYVAGRIALAKLYFAASRPDDALAQLNHPAMNPVVNLELYELRGDIYAGRGQIADARAAWDRALAVAPRGSARGRLRRKSNDTGVTSRE